MATSFSCIAARCSNGGIGYKGDLPWPRLKTDLKFLREKSVTTCNPDKQNAIIMGRLTWESYSKHVRQRSNRFHIVLSRKKSQEISGSPGLVCPSLSAAMEAVQAPPHNTKIESVFIFGGEKVFEEAMLSPLCDTLYITEVLQEFPSDAFYPPIDSSLFSLKEDHNDPLIPRGVLEENGVKFKFTVYQRKQSSS